MNYLAQIQSILVSSCCLVSFSAITFNGYNQPNFFQHGKQAEDDLLKTHFIIEHQDSLIDFQPHESFNYRLTVTRESKTSVHFRMEVRTTLPQPIDPFPIEPLPEEFARYTSASRYINSNDSKIKYLADSLLSIGHFTTQDELVRLVIRYTQWHLSWGNPSELPSATDAHAVRVTNCIGYTHLAAAILRVYGIPVRTVRTFLGVGLVPHYLMEVYYPSINNWITYDPQMGSPLPENIVLYTHHDWDFDGQQRTRPMVTDPAIRVYFGTLNIRD